MTDPDRLQTPDDSVTSHDTEIFERIAVSIDSLATSNDNLAAEILAENAERKKATRIQIILLVLVLIGLSLIGFQIYQQNQEAQARSKAATEQRNALEENQNLLRSCLTPGSQCYEEGQANQRRIVLELQRQQVVIVRCDVLNDSVAGFEQCLTEAGVPVPE